MNTAQQVESDERAVHLRSAYMRAGIVAPKQLVDATHVAVATVAECDLIVSWNFKHIVHYEKIELFNRVNESEGLRRIAIYAPPEVVRYEEEEV